MRCQVCAQIKHTRSKLSKAFGIVGMCSLFREKPASTVRRETVHEEHLFTSAVLQGGRIPYKAF